jgi:hypothetical protein
MKKLNNMLTVSIGYMMAVSCFIYAMLDMPNFALFAFVVGMIGSLI